MKVKCFSKLLFVLSNIFVIFFLFCSYEWSLSWWSRLIEQVFRYVSNMLNDLAIVFRLMVLIILFYHAKIITNSSIFLSLCKFPLYISLIVWWVANSTLRSSMQKIGSKILLNGQRSILLHFKTFLLALHFCMGWSI
jgi:hypothetical protein